MTCANCGRLRKEHFDRLGWKCPNPEATGFFDRVNHGSRWKAGPERRLYLVTGHPPKRTPWREVHGTVVVDGIEHTFPVRVSTETPAEDSPHHGAVYLHFSFPSKACVDIAGKVANRGA